MPESARGAAVAAGTRALHSAEQPAPDGPAASTAVTADSQGATAGQHVISLRLEHLSELFEPPDTDLFRPGRDNYYLPGMEFAVSELRGRPYSRRPVRLEISAPTAEVMPGGDDAVAAAVRSYCEVRIRYNWAERRAALGDGLASLTVGIPVTVLGIVLVTVYQSGVIGDVVGAVLTWVGLWYPLDQLLFYPSECTRENRSLRLLAAAEVVVRTRSPDGAG